MLAADFEVIFVDDGSPDDTWRRLQQIRDSHANVRLERIEHSGWPSRPRNVGLALAQGEYVLFMDHDDEL
jgi:glycosyltransferase involved in cell wall biosynthesis